MFEKRREANSLAEISRALAEQRAKQADEVAAKPVKPPQPDAAAGPPAAALPKEKKRKRTKEVKVSDEEEERAAPSSPATKSKSKREPKDTPDAAAAAPTPAAPSLPTADDAFRDWFMARLAEDFEAEMEGLNEADAPVGARTLLQALEGSLALFSPAERRVALAVAGVQAAAHPAAS